MRELDGAPSPRRFARLRSGSDHRHSSPSLLPSPSPQTLTSPCVQVMMAVTSHGGHLGWCDRGEGWGGPGWVERVACGFLETAMELQRDEEQGGAP